jgi:hypothetical protein
MTAQADHSRIEVSTAEELSAAVADAGVITIVVRGKIANAPTIRLLPSQQLIGERDSPAIEFQPLKDGVQLTSGMRSAA